MRIRSAFAYRALRGPFRPALLLYVVVFPLLAGQGCPLLNRNPPLVDTTPLVEEVPPFVTDFINQFARQPVDNPPREIWRYTYRDQDVYLVLTGCCDQFIPLYDSAGNYMCAPSGGFTGDGDGLCPDFYQTASDRTLVWQDTRTYAPQ